MTTDETIVESGQEKGEGGSLPTPTFTGSSGDKQPSGAGLSPQDIERIIDERVEKAVQSFKDRRFDKFAKEIEQLKQAGFTQQQAEATVAVAVAGKPGSPAEGQGRPDQAKVMDKAKKVVKAAGLTLEDPEVVSLFRGEYGDPDDLYAAVTTLGVKRAKAPAPTPASTAPPVGSSQPSDDTDALVARLEQLQRNPQANMAEIHKITKQLGWA